MQDITTSEQVHIDSLRRHHQPRSQHPQKPFLAQSKSKKKLITLADYAVGSREQRLENQLQGR